MDTFKASALKLQKNLLTLRLERDRLRKEGRDNEADALCAQITRMEDVISQLPGAIKPQTLQ
jgi:hypothetical protein